MCSSNLLAAGGEEEAAGVTVTVSQWRDSPSCFPFFLFIFFNVIIYI